MAEAKRTVKEYEAITKPGFHSDGGGLYLSIVGKSRTWMFRYTFRGKPHWMGLGPVNLVTLADARRAAQAARLQLFYKIDPIEARRAAVRAREVADSQAITFEICAEKYIAAHKAGWKNAKHGDQWRATLKAYVFPVFGDKPADAVTVDMIKDVLTPIWEAKPETASRVRGRVEAILDYAKTSNWRSGENPARWKGHLDNILPRRDKVKAVKNHAALPWVNLPIVMGKLALATGTSALCLRFTILTAARPGEARDVRWGEIDLVAKTWTVPKAKMKAGREHRVPLSDAALAVLADMPPGSGNDLVFPGGMAASRSGRSAFKPLSDVAVSKALAGAAAGFTVHGMRSTFRDWAAETTAYPGEIAEAALAHSNKDKTEAAYRRTDSFDKRAAMMRAWAEFCTAPAADVA